MEWSDYHVRVTVIGLHKAGKGAGEIYKLLRPLKITERFVYRTLDRYRKTGDVVDMPRAGRTRSVRTKKAVEAVRSRINRKPCRRQKILAREMNISRRSLGRIINEDLQLKAYKKRTGQLLTPRLRDIRLKRSRELLQLYGKKFYKRILFTDEKYFYVQEKFNRQNDRIYARSSRDAREKAPPVERGHHPSAVMVWWGVSWEGATAIHFCEPGVKTTAQIYQDTILEPVVKPLNETLFHGEHWVFQQDSAPSHKAKTTQKWLEENVPDFIAESEWTSGSPDLNPLDYELWEVLEEKACAKRHPNLEALKRSIVQAAAAIPLDTLRKSIEKWPERLAKCIAAEGGHFE